MAEVELRVTRRTAASTVKTMRTDSSGVPVYGLMWLM